MNDLELIELVAGTDRYRPGTPLPELFGDSVGTLHDIERRAQMESTQRTEPVPIKPGEGPQRSDRGRWRGPWLAAAVFVAFVAIAGAAMVVFSGGDEGPMATDRTDAEALAEGYYRAYEQGDIEAMRALFAPDIAMREGPGAMTLGMWEQRVSYFVAEGAAIDDLECAELSEEPSAVVVECSFRDRTSLINAVDAEGVLVIATLRISDGAVASIDELPDYDGYRLVADPFEAWMEEFHPDDAYSATCCAFFSVDEAQERGQLRRQYANLWATYLEENGCVWDEPCEP